MNMASGVIIEPAILNASVMGVGNLNGSAYSTSATTVQIRQGFSRMPLISGFALSCKTAMPKLKRVMLNTMFAAMAYNMPDEPKNCRANGMPMNPSLPYAHKSTKMRLPPSGMGMRFRTSPKPPTTTT